MKRLLLFRGKRIDNGEWIEGKDVTRTEERIERQIEDRVVIQHKKHVFIAKAKGLPGCEVFPASVGEYTGFMDRNGTKIFEGDSVGGYYDGEPIGGTVINGDGNVITIERYKKIELSLNHDGDWLEVISKTGQSYPPQLCWDCAKATGRCSWSRTLTPVKGWYAVPSAKPGCSTYHIVDCPLFERG